MSRQITVLRPTRMAWMATALLIAAMLLAAAAPAWAGYGAGPVLARVAHNTVDDQYLVVYFNTTGGLVLGAMKGRILASDGTTEVVAEFTIAGDFAINYTGNFGDGPNPPAVAFDPISKRYLVVWSWNDGYDRIVGRLVAADGTVLAAGITDLNGDVTLDNLDSILISENSDAVGSPEVKQTPAVAYDSVNGRFLVLWADDRFGDWDILGRLVDPTAGAVLDAGVTDFDTDGITLIDAIEIASGVNVQLSPTAAFDAANGHFLVAWSEETAGALVSIDPATPASLIVRKVGELGSESFTGVAIDPDPDGDPGTDDAILYGVDATLDALFSIDPATGATTVIGSTGSSTQLIKSLVLNPAGTLLYATDASSGDLLTIDPADGTATLLRKGTVYPNALAYDSNTSTMYGYDFTLKLLFSVDVTTGILTVIGPVSAGFGNIAALAYAADSSTLYALELSTSPRRLITIDTTTGAAAAVGTTLGGTLGNAFALAYNPDANLDGTLGDPVLYTVNSAIGDQLIAINAATGAGTIVGTLPTTNTTGPHPATDFEFMVALAYAYDAATLANSVLYGIEGNNDHLVTIDTATPANTNISKVVGDVLGGLVLGVEGLTFNSDTGTLYGVDRGLVQVLTIDTGTGAATEGALLGFHNVESLAFSADGSVLYGVDGFADRLLLIDPATGVATAVGAAGALGFGVVSGLALDPDPNDDANTVDAVLYGVDDATNTVITIDPSTGVGTALGTAGNALFMDLRGLTVDPTTHTLYAVNIGFEDDIRGRLLLTDGTLYDPNPSDLLDLTDPTRGFPISAAPGNQSLPVATTDTANARFAVAWLDFHDTDEDWDGDGTNTSDVAAQFLNADGSLYDPVPGSAPDLTNPVLGHYIATAAPDKSSPYNNDPYGLGVAFDADSGTLWAVWTDYGTPAGVQYGGLVASDLSLVAPAPIDAASITDDEVAQAVFNPFCRHLLVAYSIGIYSGASDVATRVSGACAPNPGLLWPATGSGTAPRVMGPTTAVSGDAVTFSVDYYSSSDTLPAIAALWIDRDGNGQFTVASAASAAAKTGAPPPTRGLFGTSGAAPVSATTAAAVAFAALLLTGGLALRRRTRFAPALTAVVLVAASGLMLSVTMVGCGSDETTPGVVSDEVYAMTVDTSAPAALQNGDYTDGERYTVELTVSGAARTIPYRFVFSDGTNAATGAPTGDQSLVLTSP